MAEVVEVLRDPQRAQEIIDCAYREVALNPDNCFEAMVRQVDRAIDRAFRPEMAKTKPAYVERSLTLVFEREQRRARKLKARQQQIVKAKFLARKVIIFFYVHTARLTPGPIRRWLKKKIMRWDRLSRLLGLNA